MDDNFNEIRNGLTNYIFACLNSLPYEGDKAKHVLVSILTEESLKISQDENNQINMYAIKPILKSIIYIFNERINCLKQLETSNEQINKQILEYNNIISYFNQLIDNIKE